MTDPTQDFDAAEDDSFQLEKALVEYANSMAETARAAFLQQLKDDQAYFLSMGKSLSEMAMLIAGAAVIDDDAEFVRMRRRILFEARSDDTNIIALRLYYLNNRHAVDMDAVLDGEDSHKRFETRLAGFLEDYKQQHPA